MNKSELLARLEGPLGGHRAAAAALDSVLGAITAAVAAGERVTLTGFGTFERVARPARTGRNPRTGDPLEIAASATPRFRPGAALRAAVAGTAPAAAPSPAAHRVRSAVRRVAEPVPQAVPEPSSSPEIAALQKRAAHGKHGKSAKGSKAPKAVKSAKSSAGKKKKK